MLGLGNSITSGGYTAWSPSSVSNLTLWLAVNKNIQANQDSGGNTLNPVHQSNLSTMQDGDLINKWAGFGGTTLNAVQTTEVDKPQWESDAADYGGAKWTSGDFFDMSAQITSADAFSIVVRLKPVFGGARAILGHLSTEFLQFHSDKTLRIKVDNNIVDFAGGSNTFSTTAYTTIIISRNSSNQWNAYVKGGGYATETQWGTANQYENPSDVTQKGEFTISNIGCRSDDSANFVGVMKDVLVYNGTALSSAERAEMYDYLFNQQY